MLKIFAPSPNAIPEQSVSAKVKLKDVMLILFRASVVRFKADVLPDLKRRALEMTIDSTEGHTAL